MKKENKPEEIEKDIEYLDQEFPKGETKFRGQAMVLLALSRQVGREEARKEFLEKVESLQLGFMIGITAKVDGFDNSELQDYSDKLINEFCIYLKKELEMKK